MYLTLTLLTNEPELLHDPEGELLRMLEPHTPRTVFDDDVQQLVAGDVIDERVLIESRARVLTTLQRNRVQLALGRHRHARDKQRGEAITLHLENHGTRDIVATLGDDNVQQLVVASGSSRTVSGAGFVMLREADSAQSTQPQSIEETA